MGCLPRLNNFLCCISLETGGLIIGWITIVVSFLSLLGSIIILSWIAIDRTQFENPDQNFIGSFTAFIIFFSIYIVYQLITLIAAVMLIKGVRRREHSRMTLFMFFMACGVLVQFLQDLAAGWSTFFSALFLAALSFYWFVCIYSLYNQIKSEKGRAPQV